MAQVTPEVEAPQAADWRLTSAALQKVAMFQQFGREEKVFMNIPEAKLTDPDHLLSESSLWQVLTALQAKGWTMQMVPKKRQRACQPHVPEAEDLLVYLAGKEVERLRAYGIALLCSERLFQQGVLVEVQHGQPKTYYLDILSGESSGTLPDRPPQERRARVRLVRDVDENVVQPPRGQRVAHVFQQEATAEEFMLANLEDIESDRSDAESWHTHVSDTDSDVIIQHEDQHTMIQRNLCHVSIFSAFQRGLHKESSNASNPESLHVTDDTKGAQTKAKLTPGQTACLLV